MSFNDLLKSHLFTLGNLQYQKDSFVKGSQCLCWASLAEASPHVSKKDRLVTVPGGGHSVCNPGNLRSILLVWPGVCKHEAPNCCQLRSYKAGLASRVAVFTRTPCFHLCSVFWITFSVHKWLLRTMWTIANTGLIPVCRWAPLPLQTGSKLQMLLHLTCFYFSSRPVFTERAAFNPFHGVIINAASFEATQPRYIPWSTQMHGR